MEEQTERVKSHTEQSTYNVPSHVNSKEFMVIFTFLNALALVLDMTFKDQQLLSCINTETGLIIMIYVMLCVSNVQLPNKK